MNNEKKKESFPGHAYRIGATILTCMGWTSAAQEF